MRPAGSPRDAATRDGRGASTDDRHIVGRVASLGERDEMVVRAVAQLHFLTAEQVTRLFYRMGSLEYVRRKLKGLTDAGYLLRLRLPRAAPGNSPWVYGLARGGVAHLKHLEAIGEAEGVGRFRQAEQREKGYLFLAHTLAVNDVLIALLLLCRAIPALGLAELRHERDLRRAPVAVPAPRGGRTSIIPDAWLDLRLAGRGRMCLALELDRGTAGQQAFTRKLDGLLAYAAGPYQEAFGTTSLTILLATTAGPARLGHILGWCEQVLRERQAEGEAGLFLVTDLPAGAPDPATLFLSPVWYRPFERRPTAVFDRATASPTSAR